MTLLLFCKVTLPLAAMAPEVIVPVVLTLVVPPIRPLLIVLALMIELDSVLFVRVSVASRVTTVPLVGKIAVELTPVPPLEVGKSPETELDNAKFKAPNDGDVPSILSI